MVGGIVMKTIEERAYKYAEVTTWDDVDGYPSDIYATNAYNAYVAGATEQKAIDNEELLKLKSAWEKQAQINHNDEDNYNQGYHDAVEKACKWMKEQVYQEYGGGPLERLIPDTMIENFMKNMEE